MHNTGVPRFLLELRPDRADPKLREALSKKSLERSIGVIYRPATEKASHYSSAYLPDRFDYYIWFDRSEADKALEKIQPQSPVAAAET